MYYVYIHLRKTDQRVFYVGKGQGKRAWSAQSRNRHWKFVASKHGFDVIILAENLPERQALDLEILWIAAIGMKRLTNATLGGDGMSGYRATPEMKLKRSIARKGSTLKPETKAKIAASHIGLKYGPETRAKLSALRKGTKASAETRAKISNSQMGTQRARIKQKYLFFHPIHGQYIADMFEFFQTIGEHPTKLIKGKKQHIKRWVCFGPTSIDVCEPVHGHLDAATAVDDFRSVRT